MQITRTLQRAVAPLLLAPVLALAACGGGDAFEAGESATSGGGGGDAGSLVVGGADGTEMKIMENMYALVLEKAGYTVEVKSVGQREVYAPALISGEIDVVPEYAATMAEYLNKDANGSDAKTIATTDAASTVQAMAPLAEAKGLTVLEPSKAIDSNGFYVTKAFADENSLTTLSDLAALGKDLTIAAGDECLSPDRPFCATGLKGTYGMKIKGVTGDDYASSTGKQKVVQGQADLGLTGTTDGTLEGLGLVILEDDKKLQAADNLVPVVNTESAGDSKISDALNALSATLTTEDLATLNGKVDGERQKPEDVAKEYLVSKGLIDG